MRIREKEVRRYLDGVPIKTRILTGNHLTQEYWMKEDSDSGESKARISVFSSRTMKTYRFVFKFTLKTGEFYLSVLDTKGKLICVCDVGDGWTNPCNFWKSEVGFDKNLVTYKFYMKEFIVKVTNKNLDTTENTHSVEITMQKCA